VTAALALSAAHRRRLREVWRSAGWPSQDIVEAELLAAGLLERRFDDAGRVTVVVSDAGLRSIADAARRNRAARDAHEALVLRVATQMQRAGRIVWRGLSLRAGLAGEQDTTTWVIAMPDVYSIRHTTVEAFVEPVVHEVKVSRSDLLSDLRRPEKGSAYRALAAECWYVLREGIARAEEIPNDYGVMFAGPTQIDVARPAARRRFRMPLAVWMALARANAEPPFDEEAQAMLS
jgi:hypothetical protein